MFYERIARQKGKSPKKRNIILPLFANLQNFLTFPKILGYVSKKFKIKFKNIN